jgi:hypothetical protein
MVPRWMHAIPATLGEYGWYMQRRLDRVMMMMVGQEDGGCLPSHQHWESTAGRKTLERTKMSYCAAARCTVGVGVGVPVS